MKINFSSVKNETLFFLAYIVMLFSWMFENIKFVNDILPVFRFISYFFAVICIFLNFKNFKYKNLVLCIMFVLVVFISTLFSGNNIILPLCCFALASRFVEFDKFVKVDLYSKLIFSFLIIILFLFGLSDKSVFYTYTGVIRYSLGFGNPNTLGYYFFSIGADVIYLLKDKLKFSHFFIVFIIAYVISYFSHSRTSFLLIMLLFVSSFFVKKFKNILQIKYIKRIVVIMFFILTGLSLFVSKDFDPSNSFYGNLNTMFSGRIINAHRYLDKYDITLFGQEINLSNYNDTISLYLDNGYLKLLLNNGLLIYLIYAFIYYKLIDSSFKKNDRYLFIISLIYMFYGLFENVFFWLTGNAFLLYIFCNNIVLFKGGDLSEKII